MEMTDERRTPEQVADIEDTRVYSHLQLAELWTAIQNGDWAYVPELKQWRHWRESVGWEDDNEDKVLASIAEVAKRAYHRKVKGVPTYSAELAGRHSVAAGALAFAKTKCAVPLAKWDADPDVIGQPGGQVYYTGIDPLHDLCDSPEFGPPTREAKRDAYVRQESRFTEKASTDDSAVNLVWDWLEEKFPVEETRKWVQKYIGYALLSGHAHEQIALWCHGPTSTGKSTFLGMVEHLAGTYAFTVSGDLFAVGKFARNNERGYSLARGIGKRVMLVNEWPEYSALDSAYFCSVTGNDTINVRQIRKEPFDYRPAFKALFASNSLPVDGLTPQVMRRLVTVEMAEGHKESIDRDLWRKLTEPLAVEAFGEWVNEGFWSWQHEGLRKDMPAPATELPKDPARLLIEKAIIAEKLIARQDGRIPAGQLAEILQPFAKEVPEVGELSQHMIGRLCTASLTSKLVQGKKHYSGFVAA